MNRILYSANGIFKSQYNRFKVAKRSLASSADNYFPSLLFSTNVVIASWSKAYFIIGFLFLYTLSLSSSSFIYFNLKKSFSQSLELPLLDGFLTGLYGSVGSSHSILVCFFLCSFSTNWSSRISMMGRNLSSVIRSIIKDHLTKILFIEQFISIETPFPPLSISSSGHKRFCKYQFFLKDV